MKIAKVERLKSLFSSVGSLRSHQSATLPTLIPHFKLVTSNIMDNRSFRLDSYSGDLSFCLILSKPLILNLELIHPELRETFASIYPPHILTNFYEDTCIDLYI